MEEPARTDGNTFEMAASASKEGLTDPNVRAVERASLSCGCASSFPLSLQIDGIYGERGQRPFKKDTVRKVMKAGILVSDYALLTI